MNKYKTFKKKKKELGDKYDKFMYDMNLELVKQKETQDKELERYKNIIDKIKKLCDENTNGIDDDGYDDAYYDRVYVREIDEIIEKELKGSDE